MADNHAATELELYIANDSNLHRQQYAPILKNLATKKAKGVYKHDLAVKLFMYLVESGAKKYAMEFSGGRIGNLPWHKQFDVPTRKLVAEALTKRFEGEWNDGEYRDLLPKKYQQPAKAVKPTKSYSKNRRDGFVAPEVYYAGTSLAPSTRAKTPAQRARIAAEVDALVRSAGKR